MGKRGCLAFAVATIVVLSLRDNSFVTTAPQYS